MESPQSVLSFSIVMLKISVSMHGICRMRTSLCLQYKPHYIAAGSIFLAAKLQKVKLPKVEGKVWWMQFDVSPLQLEGTSTRAHTLTHIILSWLFLWHAKEAQAFNRKRKIKFCITTKEGLKRIVLNKRRCGVDKLSYVHYI